MCTAAGSSHPLETRVLAYLPPYLPCHCVAARSCICKSVCLSASSCCVSSFVCPCRSNTFARISVVVTVFFLRRGLVCRCLLRCISKPLYTFSAFAARPARSVLQAYFPSSLHFIIAFFNFI